MLKKEWTNGETTRSESSWWWHDMHACYPQKDSLINGASWLGALKFICKKGILHPNTLLRLNNVLLKSYIVSICGTNFTFFFCISIEITTITRNYAKIQKYFFKIKWELFFIQLHSKMRKAPLTNYVSIRHFIWSPSTFQWNISS